MTQPKLSILFVMCFLAAGCNIYRVNSEEVSTHFYPSKASAADITYMEQVNRPYEIVGFVTVNTERSESMEEVLEKIKREAAILGGDAVTNITVNSPDGWKKIPPKKLLQNAYLRANFTATVITFQGQDSAPAPAAKP